MLHGKTDPFCNAGFLESGIYQNSKSEGLKEQQDHFQTRGGFVVESVFSIPGLGRYFVQSIQNRDYPVIMGTTVFLASFIILMNMVVDILYKIADPRISLTKGGE